MNPLWMLVLFFVFVMGSVTLAGILLNRYQGHSRTLIAETLARFGKAAPGKPSEIERYRTQLTFAGYRETSYSQIFMGSKIALGLVIAGTFALFRLVAGGGGAGSLVAAIAGFGLGYLAPNSILEHAIRRRSRAILFGIPLTIDLLILALEAGQSLDSALVEAAREIRASSPELSSELSQIQGELLAGRSRPEVLRSLKDRNAQPELKRLAQVLIDADRFGAQVAPALRNHVKYLRTRLRQQAYEQARKVGVKLTFPVFFLIFPSVILVTLGPALIQIHTQFGALLGR